MAKKLKQPGFRLNIGSKIDLIKIHFNFSSFDDGSQIEREESSGLEILSRTKH